MTRPLATCCPDTSHSPRLVAGTGWTCPNCDEDRRIAAEQRANAEAKAAAHIAAEGKVTEAEWSTFLDAVRRVAADNNGVVDANKVRPLVRGRIEPKHIGTAYAVAKRVGLLERTGVNESTDAEGKNAGRPQPLYRWIGAAA